MINYGKGAMEKRGGIEFERKHLLMHSFTGGGAKHSLLLIIKGGTFDYERFSKLHPPCHE